MNACISNSVSIPRLVYLLQRGVRDAVAGEAEVSHGQVELLEQQGKGPIPGSTIRQYVGDLLTDALQEDRLGDVAPHNLTQGCQICWTNRRKNYSQNKHQRVANTTEVCGKKQISVPHVSFILFNGVVC